MFFKFITYNVQKVNQIVCGERANSPNCLWSKLGIIFIFNQSAKKLSCNLENNRVRVMGRAPKKCCSLPFFFTGEIKPNFQQSGDLPVEVISLKSTDKRF